MTYYLPDILGTLGSSMIIFTYLALQLGKLSSEKLSYSFANGLGAFLILVSLYYDFNFSAFVIEFFWLIISIFGVYKQLSMIKAHWEYLIDKKWDAQDWRNAVALSW